MKPSSAVTRTHRFTHRLLSRALLLLTVILPGASPMAFEPGDSLTLGVFPRRPAATTQAMFTPLAAQLSAILGVPVKLDSPPDLSAFQQRLNKGLYQLVHLNQYQYLRAHAEHGFDAIAMNEEFGSDRIAAVIWVNADSPLQDIDELRGKTLLLGGGHDAMMASIVPRYLLMQAGLPAGSYLVRSTVNPVKAVLALIYHQGDAAGGGEVIPRLPSIEKKMAGKRLRELARSEPLTQLPWAISPAVSADNAALIADALQQLNQTVAGKAALKSAALTGLRRATDSDYARHRDIVRKVLGEDYQ